MPHTSARPQERDRLRKRAVSFALLCAAGHILLTSDERAARLAYGAGIAPAALLCAAGHILPSSDERAVCPAYGAKIAPAALLCAAGHILQPSDERVACPAYGAGIAPAAPFYVGTDDKAGMPSFARPAASGGHKSRISRRACQLPAGMPHTQEVFCNDKQSLSLNHAVQAAPFTQGSLQCGKSPRGGRQKISAATGRSTNVRVALGLVNKGYARPAFGDTSRRRSIMKDHRLSR